MSETGDGLTSMSFSCHRNYKMRRNMRRKERRGRVETKKCIEDTLNGDKAEEETDREFNSTQNNTH